MTAIQNSFEELLHTLIHNYAPNIHVHKITLSQPTACLTVSSLVVSFLTISFLANQHQTDLPWVLPLMACPEVAD